MCCSVGERPANSTNLYSPPTIHNWLSSSYTYHKLWSTTCCHPHQHHHRPIRRERLNGFDILQGMSNGRHKQTDRNTPTLTLWLIDSNDQEEAVNFSSLQTQAIHNVCPNRPELQKEPNNLSYLPRWTNLSQLFCALIYHNKAILRYKNFKSAAPTQFEGTLKTNKKCSETSIPLCSR